MSVAAYLDRHGNLIGDAAVRRLLEQTIRTEYGAEPDEASALQLIFNLPTVDGEAYEVLGTSDERYVITGGSQRITDALAEAHADRIETGRRLVALAPTDGGGVTLRFAGGDEVDRRPGDPRHPAEPARRDRSRRAAVGRLAGLRARGPARRQREAQRGLSQQAVDRDADGHRRRDLGPERRRAVLRSLGMHRRHSPAAAR